MPLCVHVDEPILRLIAGPGPLMVIGAGLAGVAASRLRRRVFDFLDRRFFREAYDSKLILLGFVERTRTARNVQELCRLLTSEIDRALHLTGATVFTVDGSSGYLVSVDQKHRPLSVTSVLAAQLASDSTALEIDEDSDPTFRRLPFEDRQWLAEGAFRLLVPLLGSGGAFLGAIALGGSKSKLPFSCEDRLLLETIAGSGALVLENRLSRSQNGGSDNTSVVPGETNFDAAKGVGSELAAECPGCRRLQQPTDSSCGQCGRHLVRASVPFVLHGKFRFEERVGSGAMGIVYRAVDLDLGRTVAIKTLPSMSPKYSLQLRREARVMASVQHPNLAMIYGAETWCGTPMMVFEYLEGGTLVERISHAPMTVEATLEIGLALSDALDRVHSKGILHRDIKPSNIGYTGDGQIKLMDFGLAHMVFDLHRRGALAPVKSTAEQERDSDSACEITWTRKIVGTPLYLSPEAIRGEPPGPCFDLWSLSVVLYEALAGRNPIGGKDVQDTLCFIARHEISDIRELRSDLDESVARFFRLALSRNKARRPQDAAEMRVRLGRLRAELENDGDVLPNPNYTEKVASGHRS